MSSQKEALLKLRDATRKMLQMQLAEIKEKRKE